MKKLCFGLIAVLLMTACKNEIINQSRSIGTQLKTEMGKTIYTYAGFTAQDLKNRASIPSQADIVVGSNYIICSSVDIPSEIRDVIGESSNDLGTLHASPKVNVWSGFGPREWIPAGQTLQNRELEVPGMPGWKDISDFCGYNHNAVIPNPPGASFVYSVGAGSGHMDASIAMRFKPGEYDWGKLNATHCRIIVLYDNGVTFAESVIKPLNTAGGWVTFDAVAFTINTASAYSVIYRTYIMLCQADGNDLYYIPVEGSVSIDVVAVVGVSVSTNFNGNIKGFSSTGYAIEENGDYRITKTHNSSFGVDVDNKTLQSIIFTVRNTSTGVTTATATYTAFTVNDAPQFTDSYLNGDTETFWVEGSGRLRAGNGEQLSIVMNYV